MTRKEIVQWLVLGFLVLTTMFNNFLLHHMEDQLDVVVEVVVGDD